MRLFVSLYGTIATFSEKYGTTVGGLGGYFSNRRLPGTPVLLKFYELGCNINWLLTGEGSMFAENAAGAALKARYEKEHEPKE